MLCLRVRHYLSILVYAGLSLFIISGPYLFMVVCVLYAYNLTLEQNKIQKKVTSNNLDPRTVVLICRVYLLQEKLGFFSLYILTCVVYLWNMQDLARYGVKYS